VSATVGLAIELGDTARRERIGIGLVGIAVHDRRRRVRREAARIGAGGRRDLVASISRDARHARPVVVGRDQTGVGPNAAATLVYEFMSHAVRRVDFHAESF
jgi:hypothetical protein